MLRLSMQRFAGISPRTSSLSCTLSAVPSHLSASPSVPLASSHSRRHRGVAIPKTNHDHEQEWEHRTGLGAAEIHGMYHHLGRVPIPTFLKDPKTVSVIGCPMSYGQPIAGTDQGAQMLRDAGLHTTLTDLEWQVNEVGDLKFEAPKESDPQPDEKILQGKAKNCYTVGSALKKIHDASKKAAVDGEFALVLGGDHSISAGSVSGILAARPDTGIIWVDAHGDLNTPSSSPSGNMHGMPVGLMLGLEDHTNLPGFEWMADVPQLKPEQIVFVGLRDLDPAEIKVIHTLGIKAYTMQHVDKYGIGGVMDRAINHLRLPDGSLRPLHMSYDIDAVDPEHAPSTGTVVRGGFNFREAHYIAEAVGETGMLGSLDMVEVNPMLKPGKDADSTAHLGMALISSAMGSRIL